MSEPTCRSNRVWAMLVVVGLCGVLLAAAGPKGKTPPPSKPPATKPAPKPATGPYTVKRADFRVTIGTKGVFDADGATEIRVKPKAWAPKAGMKVVSVAARGSTVKKGQLLLKLDTEDIDKAIQDAELTQQAADLSFKIAEQEFAAKVKAHKLDVAAADRAKAQADEDYQRYLKIEKPLAIEKAHRSLVSAERSLYYVREELRQLEKMYKADDLTEETEEIILKRQRWAVERAEHSFKLQKLAVEKTLKTDIPRQDIVAREANERRAIDYAKTKVTAEAAFEKARIEFEKLKIAHARSGKKLPDLKKDRAAMTVTSPAAGMLLHAGSANGTWPKLTRSLKAGDSILPGEVAMTVITPGKVIVRTKASEKDMTRLHVGMACEVTPAAYPKAKLAGKVTSVDVAPAGGNIAITIAVAPSKAAPRLLPMMNATVTLLVADRPKALTVPAGYVHADDKDAGRRVVYVRKGRGAEKRAVTVGATGAGKTEILTGLKEGDVVLPDKGK